MYELDQAQQATDSQLQQYVKRPRTNNGAVNEIQCPDPGLIGYIQFIDSVFPAYEVFVEEMMAEGDKVIVRARFRGRHEGTIMGLKPRTRPLSIRLW